MRRGAGLPWVVAGQFIGALADNALLLVAIAALAERGSPPWTVPALRVAFYLAFVLLAAHASALADAWPKQAVIAAVQVLKLAGCALLLAGASPLWAYALVGLGAAAHAPARYGILSELSAPGGLVAANAALEVATVLALLLGTLWGSLMLRGLAVLPVHAGSPATRAALTLALAYATAAACALPVRSRAAGPRRAIPHAGRARQFGRSVATLLADPLARTCLLVTATFWAVAAVLQFLVLRWAVERLGLPLADAGLLQAAVACGMVTGAVAAGRWVRERSALAVLPAGGVLGLALAALPWLHDARVTAALLFGAGVLAGVLIVPLNAVLQRRGALLMTAGQAIGAQNAGENAASLAGLAAYGIAVAAHAGLSSTVVALGLLLFAAMAGAIAAGRRLQTA